MKFYKAAAQQEVCGLNLKFYPAQVAARIVQSRKFSGGTVDGRYGASKENFSVGKFTRCAKFNAPKRHLNLKEKR